MDDRRMWRAIFYLLTALAAVAVWFEVYPLALFWTLQCAIPFARSRYWEQ